MRLLIFLLIALSCAAMPAWVKFQTAQPAVTVLGPPLYQTNLLHWWLANGNGTDSASTNDLNLYIGGPISFANGLSGLQAFSFNGNQWATTTNGSLNISSFSNLTVTLWFNVANGYSGGGGFFCIQRVTTGNGSTNSFRSLPLFMTSSGTVGMGSYISGGKTAISTSAYNNGAWHQIAGVWTVTNGMTLYVDGNLSATYGPANALSALSWFPQYFRVGDGCFTNWGYTATNSGINGLVQDVRVYTNALSASQISALYSRGVY